MGKIFGNGCSAKHGLLLGIFVTIVAILVPLVTSAMTARVNADMARVEAAGQGREDRLRAVEQTQAATKEMLQSMDKKLDRTEQKVDELLKGNSR